MILWRAELFENMACLKNYPRMNSTVYSSIGHSSATLIAVLAKPGVNSTSAVFDDTRKRPIYLWLPESFSTSDSFIRWEEDAPALLQTQWQKKHSKEMRGCQRASQECDSYQMRRWGGYQRFNWLNLNSTKTVSRSTWVVTHWRLPFFSPLKW
jgi:hypothetical protein